MAILLGSLALAKERNVAIISSPFPIGCLCTPDLATLTYSTCASSDLFASSHLHQRIIGSLTVSFLQHYHHGQSHHGIISSLLWHKHVFVTSTTMHFRLAWKHGPGRDQWPGANGLPQGSKRIRLDSLGRPTYTSRAMSCNTSPLFNSRRRNMRRSF